MMGFMVPFMMSGFGNAFSAWNPLLWLFAILGLFLPFMGYTGIPLQ